MFFGRFLITLNCLLYAAIALWALFAPQSVLQRLGIEAMSQAMALTISSTHEYHQTHGPGLLLYSVSNANFKREALPGMEILITANISSFKRGIAKGHLTCEEKEKLIYSSDQTIIVQDSMRVLQ